MVWELGNFEGLGVKVQELGFGAQEKAQRVCARFRVLSSGGLTNSDMLIGLFETTKTTHTLPCQSHSVVVVEAVQCRQCQQ